MALFMAPVFGVTGGNLTYKFAKSRGMIHYYSVLRSKHPALKQSMNALRRLAIAISTAVDTLHDFINTNFQVTETFPTDPVTILHMAGQGNIDVRKSFCNSQDVGQPGKTAWAAYERTIDEAKEICRNTVGMALMTNFGFHAMHTGHGPEDFVMPGGLGEVSSDYRQTSEEMITSSDVLTRGALKKRKWTQERDLYHQHIYTKTMWEFIVVRTYNTTSLLL